MYQHNITPVKRTKEQRRALKNSRIEKVRKIREMNYIREVLRQQEEDEENQRQYFLNILTQLVNLTFEGYKTAISHGFVVTRINPVLTFSNGETATVRMQDEEVNVEEDDQDYEEKDDIYVKLEEKEVIEDNNNSINNANSDNEEDCIFIKGVKINN